MSIWIKAYLALAFVIGWGTFIYARELSSADDEKGAQKPIWFGGIQNVYLVSRILKKHAVNGNRLALWAYWLNLLIFAVMPILMVILVFQGPGKQ
ncbi:hypothetical protein [Rhizobium sp. C4]|uniref:hypothetical protein n=1 Tax=Rhizobium sp. C4 TaxID=1349800 RepID=UPI001E3AB61D|nr:hypothetical protein [Rhizobium sp. C4]MCD2171772.1 hypothetical protein [Rhizobium sp. C4]